jgi:hypothetical protein
MPFGMAAEVTGCDIAFDLGDCVLKAGNTPVFAFDEGTDKGVIYEISNAPPDVPPDQPFPPNGGHFPLYYRHLFKNNEPAEEFDLFPEDDPNPAPDPATCGGTSLGQRDGGL